MKYIFRCQFGSHVYGTNLPESDTDFKGIFLPEFRDIILQRPKSVITLNTGTDDSKNTADDVDEELFALHKWFTLFIQGQTLCYDMLFTPQSFWTNHGGPWYEIVRGKDKLLNSKISAFAGYCQAQAAKYSLKGSNLAAYRMAVEFFKRQPPHARLSSISDLIFELISVAAKEAIYNEKSERLIRVVSIPHKVTGLEEFYLQVGPKTKVPMSASCKLAADIFQQQFDKYGARAKQAETNQGVDWKALMHAVRVCEEAKELLLTGNITFPRPESPFLLKIRKGEIHYRDVAEYIEIGLKGLHEAKAKTSLPDEPDKQWIEDFIFDIYSSHR